MSHRSDFNDTAAGGGAVIQKLVCLTIPLKPDALEIVEIKNLVKVDSCDIDNGFVIVNARLIKNVIFKTRDRDHDHRHHHHDCVVCGDVRHCTAETEFCAFAPIRDWDCDDLVCKVKDARVVAEVVEPVFDHDGKIKKVIVKVVVKIVVKAVKKDW